MSSLFDIKPRSKKDVVTLNPGDRYSSTGEVTRYSGGGTGGGGGGGWSTEAITQYAQDLEQEQMDVADATHSDPNSAEEGRRQFYENNPAMKRYRRRQAQGKAIKKDPDYYSKLVDSMPASGDTFGIKPIFRQEETDIPSVSNQALSDTAATIAQIPDATAGAFKQGAGGVLQALGTPGEQQNYAGPMQGIEMLSDTLKSQFGKPVVDYGEDLYETGTQQYQQAFEQAPYEMPLEVATVVTQMIPSVAAQIATRNPVISLSPIFGQVYGSKFAQSRSEGRSPEEAHMDGMAFGASEVLTEAIPLGFITKVGGNWVWNAAKSGMAEAVQEPVNQVIQNLYDIGVLNKDMTLDEVIAGIKHTSEVGGISGVILSALAAPFTRARGTVPPVASGDIPNLPALPQGPAQDVAPSATQDPYYWRTPPSVGPVDPSRRKFLQNVGDIATVAATTPTDLLPNLTEAAPAAVEAAAPPVYKLSMDYLNLPMPTDYVFDINGKGFYAMTPDHIDIEDGETFVQFSDKMGGDDLPPGVPNHIDLIDYLDPVEEISQADIDKAVARAIQDNLIGPGDEFFLGDVRRYYDEAGNNANPATFGEIEWMESQNNPEGIFDEVFSSANILTPSTRYSTALTNLSGDKQKGSTSTRKNMLTGGFEHTTYPRKPILRDPTELEDSDWQSPFEAEVEREALKIAERDRIEELARDREVTEAIPELSVLQRQLAAARDNLKALEAGIAPEGYEGLYTQEDFDRDIRIEKDHIATLEKEEIPVKEREPIEGEYEEDKTVLRMSKRKYGGDPEKPDLINSNEDLKRRVLELRDQGMKSKDIWKKVRGEIQPSYARKPNNIIYRAGRDGKSSLSNEVYGILKDAGVNNRGYDQVAWLEPFVVDGKKIPQSAKAQKEIRALGNIAELKEKAGEKLTKKEEYDLRVYNEQKRRGRLIAKRAWDNKQESRSSSRKGQEWWLGADKLSEEEQRALAEEKAYTNYQQFKSRSRIRQYETVDGKKRKIKGSKPVGNVFLGVGNVEEETKIMDLFIEAAMKTIREQSPYHVHHGIPFGSPRIVDGKPTGGYVNVRGGEPQGVGLSTSANMRIMPGPDNISQSNIVSKEEIDELIAEDARQAKKGIVTKSLNLNVIDSDRVPNPDLLGPISFEDNNTGRVVRITGFKWLAGVDYDKVLNNVDLRGRAHKIPGNKRASVNMAFVYVPNNENDVIYQEFEEDVRDSLGASQDARATGVYQVAINLAAFSDSTVEGVIYHDARRANISAKTLKKKIEKRGITNLEYAIQSTINHEFTHINHFAWEREVLGGSALVEGSGWNFNNRDLSRKRNLLYQHLRPEIIEFLKSEGSDAYKILGLKELLRSTNNREALIGLDMLFNATSKPISLAQHQTIASKAMFIILTEMAAYQASTKVNNLEGWFTKLKRAIKNILKKFGGKFKQSHVDDLIDNINSNNEIDESLLVTRIMRGEKVPLDIYQQSIQKNIDETLKDAGISQDGFISTDRWEEVLKIAEKNEVPKKILDDFKKSTSPVVHEIPINEMYNILHTHTELVYGYDEFAERIEDESDTDSYIEIVSIVSAIDWLSNIPIDSFEGREDINIGNTVVDLESRLDNILGIGENRGTWVRAWARPKDSNQNYTEQFEDVMNNQAGNAETPGYTSPLSQELDRSDDAAQREYTGADSVSRPKARERTTLRNLFQHLYSRAAQTVRRHSGSSKTAGLIADMILRAPHVKQREKGAKAGRDYVQKKSMAMGEFRLDIQRALDELTNRGGVIPKKVNDQLREYFLDGTIPRNGRVAAAVSQLESAIERIYAWSDRVGTKYTEDFSLRPVDGGKLPRVYDTDKVASPDGRRKLMDLLESIGIVNDPTNDKYDATDIYNIILNSGGFVSGDFTESARNIGIDGMQTQRELFERIEREISRDQLGDLLLTDYQAIIPRFVDKAIEKTVYAEMFGHKNEHLLELKQKVREEIETHNRESDTFIDPDHVMKSIDEMMDIIHHRYKVNTVPTRGRKVIQAAMNATTMASLTLVSLASMPEFFTMTALGSKNPAKFATNVMGAATYAALKGLNGINKLLTGRVMKGYFDPKTKIGKRAKFLRELGLYDISSLGEAAAQRYVGPSFIKAGVGSTGNSFAIRALYRLYGLGNLEKGRFRARQGRALMNMDTYFEINMLTTMTQMQQMMALKNLEQNIISDAKALSKAAKGKGMKLKSTIAQIKSNLKGYGLSESEIDELVRWYDAGHRELYDVPPEFKLDLAGPAHRFVQSVITLPSEGSLPKVFRDPRFAPFLLFKSFITTFGNTFINTIAQRVRFAEGSGVSKKYQQGKQIAGFMGTAAAMYGAVQFAQAIGYLIKYGDDEDPWEDTVPPWAEFMRDFERTGLFGPLGSLLVQTVTPNYWSWKGKDPYEDALRDLVGPMGRQMQNIGMTAADVAQGKELDLEGRLAKAVPLTKSEPIRKAIGADPYYTKDKKGKLIRRRTLERRKEKKEAKAEAKRQTILDSIPKSAAKALDLSPHDIVSMSKKDLDKYIKDKHGIDVDGRKSKVRMLEEFLEKKQ